MKLSRLLSKKSVQIPLKSLTKNEVLAEMVDLLVNCCELKNRDDILEKILSREQKMSTGIGYGVAVPHAKCDGINDICIAAGVSKTGVPFEAIDDEAVYLFFIMISPTNTVGPHIQTLAAVSRLMSYEDVRTSLKNIKDADDFLRILAEAEAKYS